MSIAVVDWFKRAIVRGSSKAVANEPEVLEIVRRIEVGEAFVTDVAITSYAKLYQACFELLMKKHGETAPVLGNWTIAAFSCSGCGRAFPSSFKLHLTNPGLLGGHQPRSDCPNCGSRVARIAYTPPSNEVQQT